MQIKNLIFLIRKILSGVFVKVMLTRVFLLLTVVVSVYGQRIEFPSDDGLAITADMYLLENSEAPFIVLFHQAGWSRGEYLEIAPKLNSLGFSCMAIDQRSGKSVNDVDNETAIRAKKEGKPSSYTDAVPDLLAALKYVRYKYSPKTVIGWGSSYSSALILKLAGDDPKLVDGILSFAPGEYFEKLGKPSDWITTSARNISVPVFITSAREEKPNWINIYNSIKSDKKEMFIPETAGNHGSRALWEKFEDSESYWKAVKKFLAQFK